jgi:hypothetical protein
LYGTGTTILRVKITVYDEKSTEINLSNPGLHVGGFTAQADKVPAPFVIVNLTGQKRNFNPGELEVNNLDCK